MKVIFEVTASMEFGEHAANYARVDFTEEHRNRILELQDAVKKVDALHIESMDHSLEVVDDYSDPDGEEDFRKEEDFRIDGCRLIVSPDSLEFAFCEKHGIQEYCTEPYKIEQFLKDFEASQG